MRVSTTKSHSSTCGWSPAYRDLVANQFLYIPAISINWTLISSKRRCCRCLVLLLPRVRAATSTTHAPSLLESDIRFVLSRTHGIPFIGTRNGNDCFVCRVLIPGENCSSRSAICCAIVTRIVAVGS